MTDFTDEMDKLAAQLAKDANASEKAFGDRLDAFKALMPYYALLLKNRGKDDSSDDLPNFDNFQASIHQASPNGFAPVKENGNGSDEPGLSGRSRRNGS